MIADDIDADDSVSLPVLSSTRSSPNATDSAIKMVRQNATAIDEDASSSRSLANYANFQPPTITESHHHHQQQNGRIHGASVLRRIMSFRSNRQPSSVSMRSETSRSHVLLFRRVGRRLQRTQIQLRRRSTNLLHVFYLLALPVYTLLGAAVFQALDGEYDDRIMLDYEQRCEQTKDTVLNELRQQCDGNERFGKDCLQLANIAVHRIDRCFRDWHRVNRTIGHPLSDFTNAIVYAFSVYTTIGYGNMAADTTGARVATLCYGIFGIPLFFAFIKEEGNLCRACFMRLYENVRRLQTRFVFSQKQSPSSLEATFTKATDGRTKRALLNRQASSISSTTAGGQMLMRLAERRYIFIAGVCTFAVYLLAISALFCASNADNWNFFISFYFLFNSVALIGFGDVFPTNPVIVLYNMPFIVLGVVLFSMCYFILQEEIRDKAFAASRKARISISKYGHTLISHTINHSPWSRRNSPAFDLERSGGSGFDRLRKRRQSAPAVAGVSLSPPIQTTATTCQEGTDVVE